MAEKWERELEEILRANSVIAESPRLDWRRELADFLTFFDEFEDGGYSI